MWPSPLRLRTVWQHCAVPDNAQDWQEEHDALLATMRPHDLPILYHYTTVTGALAILTSGRIRLSSSTGMNDHAEGQWVPAALLNWMTGRPDIEASRAFNTLWQVAIAPYDRAYLTCFSEEGDLLSQWRAYSQDGEGIAIGFNANDGHLPVINAEPHTNAGPGLELTISKVRYDNDMSLVTNAVEQATSGGTASAAFMQAQTLLIQERWRLKNPAFREEHEWRIINLPMDFDGDIGGGKTTVSAVGERRFCESRGRIVSYYNVVFSKAAVAELVLGPQCRVDEAELRTLLRAKGLEPRVWRSAATYRR